MVGDIVGRETSLSELAELVEEAVSGRGSLVLLAGEAGVGKTRLALHALDDPRALLLRGAAEDGPTAPYGPIVEVLRGAFRSRPQAIDRLGRLMPHLAVLLPELGPAPPDGDRATLVEAIRSAFDAVAAGSPVFVLLDDLHWADAATVELLTALADVAETRSLLFVGTYRTDDLQRGHPLRRARTELRRARRLRELSIEPLDEHATRLLAAEVLGGPVAPALAAAIWHRSQGMPFFVEELGATLLSGDRLVAVENVLELASHADVPLPDTVRDAVLARIDGIPDAARAVLEAAAVVGSAAELRLLVELAGAEGLDAALASGLLVEQVNGRTAFRHALAREAVHAEIPWSRRQELHARLCDLLEAASAEPELVAAEALAAGQRERAVPFLLAAAERFCALHAYRDAAGAARQALELWTAEADDPIRLETLARLGRCLQLAGDVRQSVPVWREVVDRCTRLGDLRGCAKAHRQLGEALDTLGRGADAYASLIAAADLFAELGDTADAARARIWAAGAARVLRDHAAAAALLRQAQEEARSCADEELRLTAQALEGHALATQGNTEDGLMLARQALGEALAGSFAEAASEAYWALAAILLNSGDADAARSTLEEAIEYCETSGQEATRQFCVGCLALVLWKSGEWDRTVDLCRDVYAVPDALGFSHGHAAVAWGCVEAARGRARQALPLLAEAVHFQSAAGKPGGRESAAAFGRLEAERGDVDAATDRCRRLFEILPDFPDASFVAPLRWAASHLATQGDATATAACGEAIARIGANYPNVEARAALAATLGESALLAGDAERAVEYFTHAVALYGEIETPFERSETLVRAAAASVAAGERDAAVQQLVDAYRTARRLGARPLARRAVTALDALGERVDERLGQRGRADLRHEGLTRRELEVLRHVAVGRTNREIAEELFLSVRTVEMHVRNALGKLGCRTRTQAATRAIELGLIQTSAAL